MKTPVGHGFALRAPIVVAPATPLLLRCARCPWWKKRSTEARRAADFAAHVAGKRHRGITWSTSRHDRRYGV